MNATFDNRIKSHAKKVAKLNNGQFSTQAANGWCFLNKINLFSILKLEIDEKNQHAIYRILSKIDDLDRIFDIVVLSHLLVECNNNSAVGVGGGGD